MYTLIRCIFCGLLLFAGFIFLRHNGKRAQTKKKIFILSVIMLVSLVTTLLPVENLFVTFDSAEAAYEYYTSNKASFVVKGKDYDLVVGNKGETENLVIVPKTEDGWKIGTGAKVKMEATKSAEGMIVNVYCYKGSDEYFISLHSLYGEKISSISDSKATEFVHFELENGTNVYYGNVNDFKDGYFIHVEGVQIRFD